MNYFRISLFCSPSRLIKYTLLVAAFLAFANSIAVAQTDTDAENAVLLFNSGQDKHEKGDLAAAIGFYKQAISALPNFPEAHYQLGTAFAALEKPDLAEQAFRNAVALKPDWTLALSALGSSLIQQKSYAEAEATLQKVLDIEPNNQPALSGLAEVVLVSNAQSAQVTQILSRISTFLAKNVGTAALWAARAALETRSGDKKAAASSLRSALAIDNGNVSALFQLADLALSGGDLIKVTEILVQLERIKGQTNASKLLRARLLAAEGNLSAAEEILRTTSETLPGVKELKNSLETARSTNAGELEKLLEKNSNDILVLGRLCSLFRREAPDKAITYCRRAAEAEPSNISHAVGYGAALVQAKEFVRAVSILKKIVEFSPSNATAHANLATALFQLKQYVEAKTEFLWLTSLQPTVPAPYFFLAISHDQLGEYMDALANYQLYLKYADAALNTNDIERVNLRLPAVQKLVKAGKGRRKD